MIRVPALIRRALVGGVLLIAVIGTVAGVSAFVVVNARHSYGGGLALTDAALFSPSAVTWSFFSRFSSFLFESWWLSLGWVRYRPPAWWVTIAVLIVVMAAVGIGRRLLQAEDSRSRALLLLAIVGCAVQLSALYWAYFRLGHGALGKSMFPCLVPALLLLWTGFESLVPVPYRRLAALGLVLSFAMLDAAAWALVAVPAYASY